MDAPPAPPEIPPMPPMDAPAPPEMPPMPPMDAPPAPLRCHLCHQWMHHRHHQRYRNANGRAACSTPPMPPMDAPPPHEMLLMHYISPTKCRQWVTRAQRNTLAPPAPPENEQAESAPADLLLSPLTDIPAEESEAEQENMSPDDLTGEQAGATINLVMMLKRSRR